MRLRPARSMRTINNQAFSRYSIKKPRKNYVKAMPHTSLLVFRMGKANQNYDMHVVLESEQNVQIRSNSLESARQAANKHLESELAGSYYLTVVPFPHQVIREKRMATGAGADRVSKGMTLSYGKPTSVAARLYKGQAVFALDISSSKRLVAKEAFRRASSKMSGTYKIKFQPILKVPVAN
jgi:large subunit ribosomal protein L10e